MVALALLVGVSVCAFAFGAASPVQAISSTIVISQIYGGGGNADAAYNADFVELLNLGNSTQSLNGWSVQYASAEAETWNNGNKVDLPDVELAPGQRYLIQLSVEGTNGAPLPVPDAIGAVAIASTAGKIALVSSTTLLVGSGCPFSSAVVDFVAYGSNANCSETLSAPAASDTNAIERAQDGCLDSDNNQSDFFVNAPHPRNTTDFFTLCFPPTATTTPTFTPIHTWTGTPSPTETPKTAANTPLPVSHLVISQIYTFGGSSGAAYQNDFVELFNPGGSPIPLKGLTLQYSEANGNRWQAQVFLSDVFLAPGQSYLVQMASGGTNGALLPVSDLTSALPLEPSGGKLALVSGSEFLNGTGCPLESRVIDFVGYGTAVNCFEGSGGARVTESASAIQRQVGGCQDTENNAGDFEPSAANPHNREAPLRYCRATATPTRNNTLTPTLTATDTPTPSEAAFTRTPTSTPTRTRAAGEFPTSPPNSISKMVISEFRMSGPGGSNDEYIELYNASSVEINLDGWKLLAADQVGGPFQLYTIRDIAVVPGQHFLLANGGPSGFSGNIISDGNFGAGIPDNGGIALLNAGDVIVDQIGLGDAGAFGEGARLDPPGSLTDAAYERKQGGAAGNCIDTDDNRTDFILGASNPQNLASPLVYCIGLATATPTYTLTPTATQTQTPTLTPFAASVRVNEFLPRPASDWNGDNKIDAQDEWIELYNSNGFKVDLSGWQLDDVENDGARPFVLPDDTNIPANGFLIVYGSESGISLNDSGTEAVRLLFPDNAIADATTYNQSIADGSFARNPDGIGEFTTGCLPTPLAPNCTITPTATTTSTTEPGYARRDVSINEIAWGGTSASDADEWIELVNNTNAQVSLDGWRLEAADGTIDIHLTGSIPAYEYFLLERSDDQTISDLFADQIYTGALEDGGELLTLFDPTGKPIDTANSAGGSWHAGSRNPPCSMERLNPLEADTPTNWQTNDNVTRNGHDDANQPICGTPNNQNSDKGNPGTPTLTPVSDGLFINEFMPQPAQDWNADGTADERDEWVEIYNANPFRVDLSGWLLDDVVNGGSSPYRIPQGTKIKRRGHLILHRAETGLALNNSNEDIRLVRSDGSLADTISYKSSDPDVAWSRNPDGGPAFTQYCAPTPRKPNCILSPTPTVTPTPYPSEIIINEFVPVPYYDWNRDSILDSGDEWIELYNRSEQTIDLGGWKLDDQKGGSGVFRIPYGTILPAHGFRVFFASETIIGLDNGGDVVRLLHPDNTPADRIKYDPLETNKSYARNPDGAESWSTRCVPTPGLPNCSQQPSPSPTRVFNLTSIAEARTLPENSRVSVLGSVVAHPCELDTFGHAMTLSDGIAGIQVYLEYPSQLSCLIPRSERIVVTGVLRDHFGLRTIYPEGNQQITRHYAPPYEIAPQHVHTGQVGESFESMPLMILGAVSNGKNGDVLWVNDGTGIVEVYADPASGASFAGITRGSIVRIYGIGYQNNQFADPNGGYHLRPRSPDDVVVLELADKLPNAPGARGGVDLGAVSIEQALSTRSQNYVTIGGVVTVPAGIISASNFWIQDENGRGARIFVDESAGEITFPRLNERVSIRGRVVSAFGAREIRVELADGIQTHGFAEGATPRAIGTGAVDFSVEGTLVAIQGFVAREDGREIYIDDGSGEVLVYIDATTRIRWSRLYPGVPARIIGVVARFRGEPEILPRFQTDVQFGVMLLPVAGVQSGYVPGLRARGRVREDLTVPRRLRAQAAVHLADHSRPNLRTRAISTQNVTTRPILNDALTLVSFLVLGASGISAALAVRKYSRGRRTKQR